MDQIWIRHGIYGVTLSLISCITLFQGYIDLGLRSVYPWVTYKINKRNNLYKKYKIKHTKESWDQYKLLRNKVVALIRKSKCLFLKSLNSNTKNFWKYIKSLKKSKKFIPDLHFNDVT